MDRVTCHLCESRPPRRSCPALGRDICAQCCGAEREQTIDCPLECEHLRDARRHEKPREPDPAGMPSSDIDLTERFLREQRTLSVVAGRLLLVSALETPGANDNDVREALESLVRTYKTADSGLIYESRPANTIAAAVADRFQQEVRQFRERVAQQSGTHSVRDKDLLGVLVFWQRMEWRNSNGKRKGRAFIESLFSLMPDMTQETTPEGPEAAAG